MKSLEQYDTTDTPKASFKIGLDTQAWDLLNKLVPTLEVAFEFFPDLEAVDIEFIKPDVDSKVAYLARVPRAWLRINGELDLYVPDDDSYGVAGYLLQIGDQVSPIPLSLFSGSHEKLFSPQRFTLTLTPSACLVRDPILVEDAQNNWSEEVRDSAVNLSGFTSHSNPGGSKRHRLSAQMSSVCELLSHELGTTVEMGKIIGSHSKDQ